MHVNVPTIAYCGTKFNCIQTRYVLYARVMFPTTNWTMMAKATLEGDAAGQAALASLCVKYRPVVLRFVRLRGLNETDAEDATQDFFENLLTSRMWQRADREQGRFRSFLCGALMHRLNSRTREAMSLKRGGGIIPQSLEEMMENGSEEPSLPESVTRAFDAAWATELMKRALTALEAAFDDDGKSDRFAALSVFLPGSSKPPVRETVAAQLGMSDNALRVELSRLRSKLREVLRGEIARTVSGPNEVDLEMTHLLSVLIQSP
jgi:RNA polymerase sigma factor (sigma-70 family)